MSTDQENQVNTDSVKESKEFEPRVIVLSNRKWDPGYYLISSKEELNQWAFDYIQNELKSENGSYLAYKEIAQESLDNIASKDELNLTEEEVAALPEFVQGEVSNKRDYYNKEEKMYKKWLKLIELMEETLKNNDRTRCWRMIDTAKGLGWHYEGDQISLEKLLTKFQ